MFSNIYYQIKDVDYLLNKTLPTFTYAPNKTINNIPIPVQFVNDDILEGEEELILEIKLLDNAKFIQTDHFSACVFITILDKTGKLK